MISPFSEAEISQFRAETPGVLHHLHFNSAGAALQPQAVVAAVIDYLEREAFTGGYRMEAEHTSVLNQGFYATAAQLLNADREEIAFAGSATHAWRTAFNGLQFSPGDEIITALPEYGSNYLAFLQAQEQFGVVLKVIPTAPNGAVDLQAMEQAISSRTRLIAITHVPSNSGLVQPTVAIGRLARAHGVLYLLDACQSLGQLPLDVAEIGCDLLTATGRKFLRGPRGTGLLYVRRSAWGKVRPTSLDIFSGHRSGEGAYAMRADARRYETYEANRALQIGMQVAMKYALQIGLERIQARVEMLADALRKALSALSGITVLDQGPQLSGIVTFIAAQKSAQEIADFMVQRQVNMAVAGEGAGYLYADTLPQKQVLRASIHYYNTLKEIAQFCSWLEKALR